MGCQAYTPVQVAPSLAGETVRVTLTDQGTAQLASLIGVGAATLDGRVAAAPDSAIDLDVSAVTRIFGAEETWKGERVRVPAADIARVETVRPAVVRSVLLAGAIVGGAILAGRAFGGGHATGGAGTTPPPATGH